MPHSAPLPTPGATDPLTAELVVDVAAAVAPAISPDGGLVAYGVVANGGRGGRPHGSIWVTAVDGSTSPRRLTDGTARDLTPKWAPDSASLFFTSDREEEGTAQLQRIRLDGSEDVTKVETLTSWRGGILDHCPLLDGRTVALLAKDEPAAEDERREVSATTPRSGAGTFPPPGCACSTWRPACSAPWTASATGMWPRSPNVRTAARWRC